MGTSQSVVAALERTGANPRYATLDRALRATGRRLEARAPSTSGACDETQLRERSAADAGGSAWPSSRRRTARSRCSPHGPACPR